MKIQYLIIILFLVFQSCETKNVHFEYYEAISFDKKDTAYLKLSEVENQFIGKYLIIYSDKTYDLGDISGEIIGDTLKGRYKYISRRNSKFTKPIVFLKQKNNLKLGTGMVSVYSQIPFYANGSIKFYDSLFLFTPKKNSEINHLKDKLIF